MRKLEVSQIIRDGLGNIIGYELNSGSIIDNEQAVYMIKKGEISNAAIESDSEGNEMIKGKGFDINDLSEME